MSPRRKKRQPKAFFIATELSKPCAQTGTLTVSHDEIKGVMPAMEMMYRVRSPEVSKGLKPGDTIDFIIDAAKYVILDVKDRRSQQVTAKAKRGAQWTPARMPTKSRPCAFETL